VGRFVVKKLIAFAFGNV